MKKLIMTALFVMFLAGNVYAEKYIAILHDFKQSAKAAAIDSDNKIQFIRVLDGRIIEVIMDINMNGQDISGNIIITDGTDKPEFVITNGIIKGNNIHLEAVLAKDSSMGSFDYYGQEPYEQKVSFILSGKQNNKNSDLFFTVTCEGPFSAFFNNEEIIFEKYVSKTETYVKKYKKNLKEYETAKIHKALENKDYYGAMNSKEMLAAFDINLGSKLNKKIDSIKDYYAKELPEKITQETIFSDVKITRTDPETASIKFKMNIGEVLPVGFIGYKIFIGEDNVFERGEQIAKYYYSGRKDIFKEENLNLKEGEEESNVKFEVTSVIMMPYPEYNYSDQKPRYFIQRTIKKAKTK